MRLVPNWWNVWLNFHRTLRLNGESIQLLRMNGICLFCLVSLTWSTERWSHTAIILLENPYIFRNVRAEHRLRLLAVAMAFRAHLMKVLMHSLFLSPHALVAAALLSLLLLLLKFSCFNLFSLFFVRFVVWCVFTAPVCPYALFSFLES